MSALIKYLIICVISSFVLIAGLLLGVRSYCVDFVSEELIDVQVRRVGFVSLGKYSVYEGCFSPWTWQVVSVPVEPVLGDECPYKFSLFGVYLSENSGGHRTKSYLKRRRAIWLMQEKEKGSGRRVRVPD